MVTLAERYGGKAVSREIYDAMVDEVAGFVENFAADHRCDLDGFHMLGTSGTVTTIAGVYLRLRRYDRRRVDGCWLSDDEISGVVDELMAMSFDERAANPCIGAERADLVLAGCAILDAIRRAFPCPRLRVADRGLREGMLVEMMREDGVWGRACPEKWEPVFRAGHASTQGSLMARLKDEKRRTLSSRTWLERQLADPYVARAKKEGFRSRAAFKLTEIDDKYHLLKHGARVVDLGAAPGGWSEIAAKRIGAEGRIIALDILDFKPMTGVEFLEARFSRRDGARSSQGDARRQGRCGAVRHGGQCHRPSSDRSSCASWRWPKPRRYFAREVLDKGGSFLCKVLQGGTEATLLAELKRDFETVKHVKPPASRTDSAELYLLARGFRG